MVFTLSTLQKHSFKFQINISIVDHSESLSN